MVLKALAVELYKAQKKVHELQDRLATCSGLEKDKVRQELRLAQSECDQLRRRVEARKEPLPFRRNFKDR